jgi:hypothetical protein
MLKIIYMEIYLDDVKINFSDLAITNFDKLVQSQKKIKNKNNLEFSSIKELKGDKELLNKAFKDQLLECITD